jgi:hypothetical protein
MDLPNLYEPIRTQVTAAQRVRCGSARWPGEMMPDLGNQDPRGPWRRVPNPRLVSGRIGWVRRDYEKGTTRRDAYKNYSAWGRSWVPTWSKAYRALDFE